MRKGAARIVVVRVVPQLREQFHFFFRGVVQGFHARHPSLNIVHLHFGPRAYHAFQIVREEVHADGLHLIVQIVSRYQFVRAHFPCGLVDVLAPEHSAERARVFFPPIHMGFLHDFLHRVVDFVFVFHYFVLHVKRFVVFHRFFNRQIAVAVNSLINGNPRNLVPGHDGADQVERDHGILSAGNRHGDFFSFFKELVDARRVAHTVLEKILKVLLAKTMGAIGEGDQALFSAPVACHGDFFLRRLKEYPLQKGSGKDSGYILGRFFACMAADDSTPTPSKSNTSGSVPPIPSWVGLLAVVVIVGVVALMLVPRIPIATDQKYVSNTSNDLPANNGYVPPVVPPVYSDTLFTLTVSPPEPKAGDNVTITATLNPIVAATDWKKNFTFEIWARQFGNWKIKSCYENPCAYTYAQASQGTLEYLVKRLAIGGDIVSEPASGAYAVNITTAVQTGDTIAPSIVVFHDPEYPRVGNTVSISASVNDISSVNGVQVYVDDQLVKTCPQKVKIAQCVHTTTSLPAGVHTYYAASTDTYGNAGTSEKADFTVLP